VVVIGVNWRPFDFTTELARFSADSEDLPQWGLRHMSWVPLADYYWGSKYHALDQFLLKALSFVPLGVLGAVSARDLFRARTLGGVLLAAFLIAVVIEVGKYFLPTHGPSVADVMIQCGGAWLGFHLTRHVRAVLWSKALFQSWDPQNRFSGLS
jgi:glycopeptide antibiotics resistance protein